MICTYCHQRLDRPAVDCSHPDDHPSLDTAERVVLAIEMDLCERHVLGALWQGLDPDTRDDIRTAWAALARAQLNEGEG
jgi:hypothetical protein